MIVYFANRKMEIVGQASTSLPKGYTIIEDLKTEEIETGVSSFECKIEFDDKSRLAVEEMTDAGNYILTKYVMPQRSLEEVRFFVGNGLLKTLERSVPEGTDAAFIQEIYPEFTAYYKEHAGVKTRPYDGITDVIRELKQSGYKLAVVSNKRQEAVLELCDLHFKDCFDIAMGDQEGMQIKPAPDMVRMAAEQLGITFEEAYYVGDSEVDVETARNAGMDGLFVLWGFRTREQLLNAGAKTLLAKPEELIGFFS